MASLNKSQISKYIQPTTAKTLASRPDVGDFNSTNDSIFNLEEIVKNRNEVSKYIGLYSSKNNLNIWTSPHDIHLRSFNFNVVQSLESLEDLSQLYQSIHENSAVAELTTQRKIIGRFTDLNLPDGSLGKPLLSEVEKKIADRGLFMSIYSIHGYNFTLEYDHVYKSESSIETLFADTKSICMRAIRAVDPSIDNKICMSYVQYILRVVSWESKYAVDVAAETLRKTIPNLKAALDTSRTILTPQVYIGYSSDFHLCFWIRMCPVISSTSDDTGSKRETEKKYEKLFKFAYYRKYMLNSSSVEEMDLAGFVDSIDDERSASADGDISVDGDATTKTTTTSTSTSSQTAARKVVPPPPKRPNKGDMYLSLIIQNEAVAVANNGETSRGGANSTGTGLQTDVEEEVNESDSDMEMDKGVATFKPRKSSSSHVQEPDLVTSDRHIADASPFAELLAWGRNSALLFSAKYLNATKNSKNESGSNMASNLDEVKNDEEVDNDGEDLSAHIAFDPANIVFPMAINLEQIRMIACSHRHLIVLTNNGTLYASGENSEGALGVGDLITRTSLTPILSWPGTPNASGQGTMGEGTDAGASNSGTGMAAGNGTSALKLIPKIMMIAAGSGSIGSHTVAIDENGHLYSWGVPYATGLGVTKPVVQPQHVDLSIVTNFAEEGSAINAALLPAEGLAYHKVIDVACGGGFTVAVLSSGKVVSWGIYSHGRLGLGKAPKFTATRGYNIFGRTKNRKKIIRYQLRPKVVGGIENAVRISCGEAHTLCLTKTGRLFSWGQNSCGQVGVGCTPSGYLRDALTPREIFLLPPVFAMDDIIKRNEIIRNNSFGVNSSVDQNIPLLKAMDICCGSFHSLVKDSKGGIWSWGARGDSCLGHNDAPLGGAWGAKVNNIFAVNTIYAQLMVPFEIVDWCNQWSLPRRIAAFGNENSFVNKQDIIQMTAGDMHSGFLCKSGRFYLCGSGAVVPPLVLQQEAPLEFDGDTASLDHEMNEEELRSHLEEVVDAMTRIVNVTIPRCPSSIWLQTVSTKRTKYICSAGAYIITLQDGDLIEYSLTSELFKQAMSNNYTSQNDNVSVNTLGTGLVSSGSVALSAIRGKADCVLISAGQSFLSHRGLVSTRCNELREMLIEEAPLDDGLPGSVFNPTQILLPEFLSETTKALVHYLYTDCLPSKSVRNLKMLLNLERAAKKLRIVRLQVACSRLIQIHKIADEAKYVNEKSFEYDEDDDNNDDEIRGKNEGVRQEALNGAQKIFHLFSRSDLSLELPNSTLARDLGSLVGDSLYADIRFIAEGRTISAHRFVLVNRCEYFRILFNSNSLTATSESDDDAVVDIVVPDTFVGLLRFLIYLYTDILPDGSDGALLEDLMSADRYQMNDMKILCENMLVPAHSNWLDLLRASQLFHCNQLETSVKCFLRDNFGDMVNNRIDNENPENSIIQHLRDEYPDLIPELLKMRQIAFPMPPSQLLVEQVALSKDEVNKIQQAQESTPWWAIVMIALALVSYNYLLRVVAFGPLIPAINLFGALGLGYYFYTMLQS